jgi:hypothetical protein
MEILTKNEKDTFNTIWNLFKNNKYPSIYLEVPSKFYDKNIFDGLKSKNYIGFDDYLTFDDSFVNVVINLGCAKNYIKDDILKSIIENNNNSDLTTKDLYNFFKNILSYNEFYTFCTEIANDKNIDLRNRNNKDEGINAHISLNKGRLFLDKGGYVQKII